MRAPKIHAEPPHLACIFVGTLSPLKVLGPAVCFPVAPAQREHDSSIFERTYLLWALGSTKVCNVWELADATNNLLPAACNYIHNFGLWEAAEIKSCFWKLADTAGLAILFWSELASCDK